MLEGVAVSEVGRDDVGRKGQSERGGEGCRVEDRERWSEGERSVWEGAVMERGNAESEGRREMKGRERDEEG